nr:C-terminal helicase domain-containing protein [Pseudomonas aeruginosa]
MRRSNEAAKLPTLAVLSPYAEQVKRIERAIIKKDLRSRFLSNLDLFAKPDDHSSFCSTVDAFQGGEADAVIISLVRNNDKGTLRSALGFLVDERRMNVLLSRCRHQLILIGSYEFIKSWAEKLSGRIEPKNQDGDFLVRLLNTLEEYKASNKMTIIPWDELQDS